MICSCSLCTAQVEAEQRRARDREAEQRCYDWQFAVVSKARAARGIRPLTYSEWISGSFEDEENPGMETTGPSRARLVALATFLILLALALALLAGCSTPAVKDRIVTVNVPVAIQPIKASDIPVPPASLGPRPPSLQQTADKALGGWCAAVAFIIKSVPLLNVSAGLPPAQAPDYPECRKH